MSRVLAAQSPVRNELEIGVGHQWVTHSLGDWGSVYSRYVRTTPRDAWYADARAQYAFGDRGVYGGAAYRRELSDRWFAIVGAGAGSSVFTLPRARADATLGLRWGPRATLVSSVVGSYIRYRSPYEDVAATISTAVYARAVTAEVGVRVNRSTPGAVTTRRAFGAITYAAGRRQTLVARADAGTEGYQLLGPSTVAVAFQSRGATVSLRQAVTSRFGVSASVEAYSNPYYSRTGVSLGVVRSW
jgi:YaiO family outer membrane protein